MSTARAFYTNLMAARNAIKDLGRLQQIARVLIRNGFGHWVTSLKGAKAEGPLKGEDARALEALESALEEPTPSHTGDPDLPDDPALKTYRRLVTILRELGPTFIKLGQILSTRSDLIPQALCDELKSLQDQVNPLPFEQLKGAIEEALGGPLSAAFTRLDEQPLACASIAQVHTAQLITGEEVVLKVQRPGIRAIIESDLSILHFLVRQAIDMIPEAETFRPDAILSEFERAIIKELDFTYEARNLSRFAKNFASWGTVHIPKLYDQYSSERVLVMERLYGVKITEAAPKGHPMDELARETVRMVFKQVFEDGFFHGDLHPGNLLILEDGRIGLIDFGMVGRLTPPMRASLADLLFHITTTHYEGVARTLYEISTHDGNINYAQWEADVVELMDRHFSTTSLADVDFGQIVRDLIEGAVRHRAQIPPDYTMFFKALMTVEGIGKVVSPDLDLLAECRPYVQRLVMERYEPERILRELVDTLHAFGRFSKRLPHTAQQLLQQVESQRLGIQLSDSHLLARQEHSRRLLNRAVVVAFALALWLIALLLGVWGQGLAWGHTLSVLAGVAGTLLAARALWRVLIIEEW